MKLLSPFVSCYHAVLHRIDKTLDRNLLKNGETYDRTLLWVLLCLLCLGLVMVYSASGSSRDIYAHGNRAYFLIKQIQFALGGLLLCFGLMRVPMWRWERWTKYLLIISLLILFLVPVFGETINGARRWLSTPLGFKIQPSETFKLMTIMYMANFFRRKADIMHNYTKALLVGIPIAVGCFAIGLTRDLGSIIVIMSLALGLLLLTNMPIKWLMSALAGFILTVALLILTSKFRMQRVMLTLRPWEDPNGTGYQTLTSLLSFNRGQFWGDGLGSGIFKRGFLPEAHTDFILAVIGEELGMVTVILLIMIYVWIVWRAFSIAKQALKLDLAFHSFIATGIGLLVGIQSFINIGVNLSLLPNKGLTLPLISYGGSSLIIMLIAFTLLLRIDYENRRKLRGFCVADPKDSMEIKKL